MIKKFLWLDTETTGVDKEKNDIIQVAFEILIAGQVRESVKIECQPFDYEAIQPKAIATHGITVAQMRKFQLPKKAHGIIIDIWKEYVNPRDREDKFILCGQNVTFDKDFMKNFFIKCSDPFFFSFIHPYSMDLYALTQMLKQLDLLDLPNLKLGTLCKHFGVKIDAHDALSDIRATREVFELIVKKYIKMPKGIK